MPEGVAGTGRYEAVNEGGETSRIWIESAPVPQPVSVPPSQQSDVERLANLERARVALQEQRQAEGETDRAARLEQDRLDNLEKARAAQVEQRQREESETKRLVDLESQRLAESEEARKRDIAAREQSARETAEREAERLDAERNRIKTAVAQHEQAVKAAEARFEQERINLQAKQKRDATEYEQGLQNDLLNVRRRLESAQDQAEADEIVTTFNRDAGTSVTGFNARLNREASDLYADQVKRAASLDADARDLNARSGSLNLRMQASNAKEAKQLDSVRLMADAYNERLAGLIKEAEAARSARERQNIMAEIGTLANATDQAADAQELQKAAAEQAKYENEVKVYQGVVARGGETDTQAYKTEMKQAEQKQEAAQAKYDAALTDYQEKVKAANVAEADYREAVSEQRKAPLDQGPVNVAAIEAEVNAAAPASGYRGEVQTIVSPGGFVITIFTNDEDRKDYQQGATEGAIMAIPVLGTVKSFQALPAQGEEGRNLAIALAAASAAADALFVLPLAGEGLRAARSAASTALKPVGFGVRTASTVEEAQAGIRLLAKGKGAAEEGALVQPDRGSPIKPVMSGGGATEGQLAAESSRGVPIKPVATNAAEEIARLKPGEEVLAIRAKTPEAIANNPRELENIKLLATEEARNNRPVVITTSVQSIQPTATELESLRLAAPTNPVAKAALSEYEQMGVTGLRKTPAGITTNNAAVSLRNAERTAQVVRSENVLSNPVQVDRVIIRLEGALDKQGARDLAAAVKETRFRDIEIIPESYSPAKVETQTVRQAAAETIAKSAEDLKAGTITSAQADAIAERLVPVVKGEYVPRSTATKAADLTEVWKDLDLVGSPDRDFRVTTKVAGFDQTRTVPAPQSSLNREAAQAVKQNRSLAVLKKETEAIERSARDYPVVLTNDVQRQVVILKGESSPTSRLRLVEYDGDVKPGGRPGGREAPVPERESPAPFGETESRTATLTRPKGGGSGDAFELRDRPDAAYFVPADAVAPRRLPVLPRIPTPGQGGDATPSPSRPSQTPTPRQPARSPFAPGLRPSVPVRPGTPTPRPGTPERPFQRPDAPTQPSQPSRPAPGALPVPVRAPSTPPGTITRPGAPTRPGVTTRPPVTPGRVSAPLPFTPSFVRNPATGQFERVTPTGTVPSAGTGRGTGTKPRNDLGTPPGGEPSIRPGTPTQPTGGTGTGPAPASGTGTRTGTNTGTGTAPGTGTGTGTGTSPATAPATATKTQTETVTALRVSTDDTTGRKITPPGTTEKPVKAPKGKPYPVVVAMGQGNTETRVHLDTGKREYAYDLSDRIPNRPDRIPQNTLIIEKFTAKPTAHNEFDAGFTHVRIDPENKRVVFSRRPNLGRGKKVKLD